MRPSVCEIFGLFLFSFISNVLFSSTIVRSPMLTKASHNAWLGPAHHERGVLPETKSCAETFDHHDLLR